MKNAIHVMYKAAMIWNVGVQIRGDVVVVTDLLHGSKQVKQADYVLA